MNILLTGSSGFIGSKVLQALIQQKYSVTPFDIHDHKDILNIEQVNREVEKNDIIVHIAAQANLYNMETIEGAKAGTDLNVQGTHNIVAACAEYKKKLVYISTVCVYGNPKQSGGYYHENKTEPRPLELYSFSKYCGEMLVKGYSANFGLEYVILRLATTYGPGMRKALGAYIFIDQAKHNKPITVHGNGKQVRTLTYISDIVSGIVCSIKSFDKAQGCTYNISSEEQISAIQMAKDIKKYTNSKSEIVFIKQRKNQTFEEYVENKKARKYLRWKPKYSWKKGIKETIKFYEA